MITLDQSDAASDSPRLPRRRRATRRAVQAPAGSREFLRRQPSQARRRRQTIATQSCSKSVQPSPCRSRGPPTGQWGRARRQARGARERSRFPRRRLKGRVLLPNARSASPYSVLRALLVARNEHERFGVPQSLGKRVDILDVIARTTPALQHRAAVERAHCVVLAVDDRDLHRAQPSARRPLAVLAQVLHPGGGHRDQRAASRRINDAR